MVDKVNFTFFERSTEFTENVQSLNLCHQLLIPEENIWIIDSHNEDIALVEKGCSAFIYPQLYYQLNTSVTKPVTVDLLSVNNIAFEGNFLSTTFLYKINKMISTIDVSLLLIDKETTKQLRPIYEKISNEFQLKWMIATLEILDLISQSPTKAVYDTSKSQKERAFYNQVNKYVGENIYNNIDIKTISSSLFLSESTFSHRFREIFNTSFHHYFIMRKIDKSCEMLKYTDDCVQTIGHVLGFKSTSHFISSFKQVKKITPGKYRQSICRQNKLDFLAKN